MKWLAAAVLPAVVALCTGAAPAVPPGAPPARPDTQQPSGIDPIPATRADGDLALTVTSIVGGELPPPSPEPPKPGEETWTHLKVRLRWAERRTGSWQLQRVALSDGEGHTWSPSKTSTRFDQDGAGEIWFAGPTWPLGSPWKVRLELARTSPFGDYRFWNTFGADELLLLSNVPLPEPGGITSLPTEVRLQGTTVRVLGLAAPHTRMPGGLPLNAEDPSVHVRVSPPRPEVHLTFLRATDAEGRVLPRGATAQGVEAGAEARAYGVKAPPGLRAVYLAFAVHRSRAFDFTLVPAAP